MMYPSPRQDHKDKITFEVTNCELQPLGNKVNILPILASDQSAGLTMKDTRTVQYSPEIHSIRDQRVILDRDLASLYGVETRVLLQAIKRNKERFPADFVFILSNQEVRRLRSQIVISNVGRGGRRNNPLAFTEHGVAMLSAVLKSERAVKVSIEIIRMFVKLRQIVLSDTGLIKRVDNLEEKTDSHARAIIGIIRELEQPVEPEKQKFGFSVEDLLGNYGSN